MNPKFRALLLEMDGLIECASADAVSAIRSGNTTGWYPPYAGITASESQAISSLRMTPQFENALRKVIAGAAASAIFHTLTC